MEREKQIEEIQKEIEKADDEFYNFCSKTECMSCKFTNKFNSITECRVYFMAQELTKNYRKERQGEWIKHGNKWKCSHCGVLMDIDGTPTENMLFYCPNCGAKMKGAE